MRTQWSLEAYIRPRRSHSNSFGNNAEKDTAGCRALDRKSIVIGGNKMRMRLHRRILKEVLETDEKERKQEIERMMPTLRSLVDDATYITGWKMA